MKKSFSRVLFGYSKSQVKEKIDKATVDIDNEFQECKNKEKTLNEENLRLKKEMQVINEKMRDYKELRGKLTEMLYESHMNAITPIYNSQKKIDEMLEYKSNIAKKLENKNEEINNAINNLILNIKSIMNDSDSNSNKI